jgi:hypothetical protein
MPFLCTFARHENTSQRARCTSRCPFSRMPTEEVDEFASAMADRVVFDNVVIDANHLQGPHYLLSHLQKFK